MGNSICEMTGEQTGHFKSVHLLLYMPKPNYEIQKLDTRFLMQRRREINRIDRWDIVSLANGLVPTKMYAKPFCENREHAGNSMLSDFMVLTRPLSERNYIRKTYNTYVCVRVCNFVYIRVIANYNS